MDIVKDLSSICFKSGRMLVPWSIVSDQKHRNAHVKPTLTVSAIKYYY